MPNFQTLECRIDSSKLPDSLYEGIPKLWSSRWIILPREIIEEMQTVVEAYLRVMSLDTMKYPARVDLWIWENGSLILYEITTGFVDQIGSCLALQESIWNTDGMSTLAQSPYDSSILTLPPYQKEYDLMRYYYARSGKILEEWIWENTFVYGYPQADMSSQCFPWKKWLDAEEKYSQSQVLSRIVVWDTFYIPRIFSTIDTPYSDLPDERYTKLVFKQNVPKKKGDRNTIVFWKGKNIQARYKNGEVIAQEYISPYRDPQGERWEIKMLFLPTPSGTEFLWAYVLWDTNPEASNFGNTIRQVPK